MIETGSEIVAALQTAIRTRIGSDRYELWFGDAVTFGCHLDRIVIRAADEFVLDQLRRGFGDLVIEESRRLAGATVQVDWRTSSDVNDTARQNRSATRHVSVSPPQRVGGPNSDSGSISRAAVATMALAPRVDPPRRTEPKTRSGPKQSFDNFVVGDNNRLAITAGRLVPKQLGEVSPLFMHGPTGCGKTHLLQAIHGAAIDSTRARCVRMSAESFTSDFLEALHGRGLPSFRRRYRSIDLLLLDDVQFFVGKRATLVEFFHTLDALHQAGRQIVLTADRPPNELNGLGSEIVARLSSGLVCAIDYPQNETRKALVEQIACSMGFPVSPTIASLMAYQLTGDARLIQGAVNRLRTAALASGSAASDEEAHRLLADLFTAARRVVAIPDIERAVCDVFGLEGRQLRSDRKSKTISQPRMLAMWLARKHTRAAYSEIGEYFGGRSHSTVISAHHRVDQWVDGKKEIVVACGNASVADTIRRIETTLRAV